MMNNYNRRNFITTTTGAAAAALAATLMSFKKPAPLLSFSTLGCPDWTFTEIIDFAASNKYNGIEIRGIKRELDLTKCNEFNTKEHILATLSSVTERKLKIVSLGSSAALHYKENIERQKHLDDAKRFIDLAAQLNCLYIRVFPNNLPKDQNIAETIDLITEGLIELGNYAKGSKVKVLMETHGDLVKTDDLSKIMRNAESDQVGLIWDIANMWNVTKQPPAEMYAQLKKYIRHTHIKDNTLIDGAIHYQLLGRGVVPIFEAIDILHKDGYKGYYSFEWEKLWHPEIGAPEIAIADYPKAMQQHFEKK